MQHNACANDKNKDAASCTAHHFQSEPSPAHKESQGKENRNDCAYYLDIACDRDGNTVKGVAIQTKTGRKLIAAKRVIDCSSDSDAAYYAGAEMLCGRPGDGMSQACLLEFTLGGVNWDEYVSSDLKKNDPRWVAKIEADLASGALTSEPDNHLNWITHIPGRPEHSGMDEVSICFAHSRNCFPCDNRDLTRMYIEGREQAHMLADYIKATVPGFKAIPHNSRLAP